MELASVVVHNASYTLDAPLVLLLNGGEETLFQGAHAFMQSRLVLVHAAVLYMLRCCA